MQMVLPGEIEEKSMSIIAEELAGMGIVVSGANDAVVKRVIHTSADFDYANSLFFTEGAVEAGIHALKAGCDIITDTMMAFSGISKAALEKCGENGARVHCFIADEDVKVTAKENSSTRAAAAAEKAARLFPNGIYVIGNAPTALIEICRLIEDGQLNPSLIVGVPVGFVNVVESKVMMKETALARNMPAILAMGRKGGSNIAASIINALLYQTVDRALL